MSTFLFFASDIERPTVLTSSATDLLFYSRLRASSQSSSTSVSVKILHGSSPTITKLHLRLRASAPSSREPLHSFSSLFIFIGLSTSFLFSRKLLFISFHFFMFNLILDHYVISVQYSHSCDSQNSESRHSFSCMTTLCKCLVCNINTQ